MPRRIIIWADEEDGVSDVEVKEDGRIPLLEEEESLPRAEGLDSKKSRGRFVVRR